MKRRTDFSLEEMIEEIRASQNSVTAVGREMSAAEQVEATAAFREMLAEFKTKFKTLCVGCGGDYPLHECAPCVCGGFVCPSCEKLETEDECLHERPGYIPADDD